MDSLRACSFLPRDKCANGLIPGIQKKKTAIGVSKHDLLKQDSVEASYRAKQVQRLAEGPHPGKLQRDSDRKHASIVRAFSFSSETSVLC